MRMGTVGTVVQAVKKGLERTVEALGTVMETGELRLPAVRDVVVAYAKAESAQEEQGVYLPLIRRYPSLQSVLDELRQTDPVSSINDIAGKIIKVQGAVRLKRVSYGVGNAQLPTGLPAVEEKLAQASRIAWEWLPKQQAFYVQVASEARALAKAHDITAVDAVAETAYRDEILSRVFPKRSEAENYLRTEDDLDARLRSATRELMAAARSAGLVKEEQPVQPTVKLPTPAAQVALQNARAEYRQRMLERVYAKR